MNLDCAICGKTSFTDIGGVPVCEDCFYSMQEGDLSFIKKNVNKFKMRKTFETIERIVCGYYNVTPDQINKKTRKREIVIARQLCHYFSKDGDLGSLSTIGKKFGRKDHATVIHSCKTINNLKETNKSFLREFNEIKEKIDNHFKTE